MAILKIIPETYLWSFQNSLNFDNSQLYVHLTRAEWLPFNFDVSNWSFGSVGNLLEFNLVNYLTGEKTDIGIGNIENNGNKYWFSGEIEFNNPDGCYYYEIVFQYVTFKSEIFQNKNPLYFERTFILTSDYNFITNELGNKIVYI